MKVSFTRAEAEALSESAECPRCDGFVRFDWVEVEPGEWVVGETACRKPGCVDEQGGQRVLLP